MADKDLGEFKKEFKLGLANLVAGIIIGHLMILGGCTVRFASGTWALVRSAAVSRR